MNTLTNNLKKRLKNTQPLAKWVFTMRNIFWWSLFGIFTFLSSFAFALILFLLLNENWQFEKFLDHSQIGVYVQTIPYFWILLYLVFLFISWHYMKNTKNAYKFPASLLTLGSLGISIVLGAILYTTHIPNTTDQLFQKTPIYKHLVSHKEERWMQEDKGRLAGTIWSYSEDEIHIEDLEKKVWTINIKNTKTSPILNIIKGEKIRIFGKKINDKEFQAERIMPWESQRGKHRSLNKNKNY